MARPNKCRKVCVLPETIRMDPVRRHPLVCEEVATPIVVTIEEYETIRLIDHIGLSQTECASYMDIARTSVQAMYQKARQKIAAALVEGRPLSIEGGNYTLCHGQERVQNCSGCYKRTMSEMTTVKGANTMKIMMPVDDSKEKICEHLGRAAYFLVKDMATGEEEYIVNAGKTANGGAGIQAAQTILDIAPEALITVRCGKNASEVLQEGQVAILQADGLDIAHNIAKYEAKELGALEHFHEGFHGHLPKGNA